MFKFNKLGHIFISALLLVIFCVSLQKILPIPISSLSYLVFILGCLFYCHFIGLFQKIQRDKVDIEKLIEELNHLSDVSSKRLRLPIITFKNKKVNPVMLALCIFILSFWLGFYKLTTWLSITCVKQLFNSFDIIWSLLFLALAGLCYLVAKWYGAEKPLISFDKLRLTPKSVQIIQYGEAIQIPWTNIKDVYEKKCNGAEYLTIIVNDCSAVDVLLKEYSFDIHLQPYRSKDIEQLVINYWLIMNGKKAHS